MEWDKINIILYHFKTTNDDTYYQVLLTVLDRVPLFIKKKYVSLIVKMS